MHDDLGVGGKALGRVGFDGRYMASRAGREEGVNDGGTERTGTGAPLWVGATARVPDK